MQIIIDQSKNKDTTTEKQLFFIYDIIEVVQHNENETSFLVNIFRNNTKIGHEQLVYDDLKETIIETGKKYQIIPSGFKGANRIGLNLTLVS